jgi:hypothetical protein
MTLAGGAQLFRFQDTKVRRPYFGGRSSPLSQPSTSPAFRGSGRSHCSHCSERGPLPPGANASFISEPHFGHLMALSLRSMTGILESRERDVHAKNQCPGIKFLSLPPPLCTTRPRLRWRPMLHRASGNKLRQSAKRNMSPRGQKRRMLQTSSECALGFGG